MMSSPILVYFQVLKIFLQINSKTVIEACQFYREYHFYSSYIVSRSDRIKTRYKFFRRYFHLHWLPIYLLYLGQKLYIHNIVYLGFMRKVYSLLAVQLGMTTLIGAALLLTPGVKQIVQVWFVFGFYGSVTSRPIRLLWQTNYPTNRTTDQPTNLAIRRT